MDEVFTIEEIRARFDGEWVLVEDPRVNGDHEVAGGDGRKKARDGYA